MLKADISITKCEHIISYPFVRLTDDEKTFQEFAEQCVRELGGTPEEWTRKNRKLLGFFGSKHGKKLVRNTRFQIPTSLVNEASNRFFETIGLSRNMRAKKFMSQSPSTFTGYADQPEASARPTPDSSPEEHKSNKMSYEV
jgi:hypothetical protein